MRSRSPVAYTFVIVSSGYSAGYGVVRSVAVVAVAVIIGLLAMRSQGLFLARVSAVRIVELTRSTRAIALAGWRHDRRRPHSSVSASAFATSRSAESSHGVLIVRQSLRLSVVGGDQAQQWAPPAASHRRRLRRRSRPADRALLPRTPTSAWQWSASSAIARRPNVTTWARLWLGELDEAEAVVAAHGASGVVVSPTAMTSARLNVLHPQPAERTTCTCTSPPASRESMRGGCGRCRCRTSRCSTSRPVARPMLQIAAEAWLRPRRSPSCCWCWPAPCIRGHRAWRSSCKTAGRSSSASSGSGRGGITFDVLKFRTMARRRREASWRRLTPPTSATGRCSRWSATRASPGSAACCARPASTSCRS